MLFASFYVRSLFGCFRQLMVPDDFTLTQEFTGPVFERGVQASRYRLTR
jgi:hypothetical protein